MKKIYICDFEDSFTFNVLSEVKLMGLNAEVVEFGEIRTFLEGLYHTEDRVVVILGPGPGHPSEYLFVQDHILAILNKENIMILGVCLGHQLLWYFQGAEVSHAKRPIHGQVINLKLNEEISRDFNLPKEILVQRYNSLAVQDKSWGKAKLSHLLTNFVKDGEVVMSKWKNGVSYQFHPESIGTSFPSIFFKPVKDFLL